MSARYDISIDPWLGELLDAPAYVLKLKSSGRLLKELLTNELATPGVFATLKLSSDQVESSIEIQRAGFIHIDTSLLFAGKLANSFDSKHAIRLARSSDMELVMSIAYESFKYSRFHNDPHFSTELANIIKSSWAGNFFQGQRGDGMLVGELDGKVVSFLQFFSSASREFIVDLIAVSKEASRKGFGTAMLAYAPVYGGASQPSVTIKVGTQARNIPSVNLYMDMGLEMISMEEVFHYHGPLVCDGYVNEEIK